MLGFRLVSGNMEEQAMSSKVLLVVPEAPAPVTAVAAESRKAGKSALRLGVLDNSKGNADYLLKFIVEGVTAAVPVASVVSLRKGNNSLPAPGGILDQLAAEADIVVSAMAD
jgi:hypothetical protein